jgi:hypothetical protein
MKDGDHQLNYHQEFDDVAQLHAGLSFVSHKKKTDVFSPETLTSRAA